MKKNINNPEVFAKRPKPTVEDMRIEHVPFDTLLESLTSDKAPRILASETWRYDGGTLKVYDYNTPATYQKYSQSKFTGGTNTTVEPYIRNGHDNKYPFFVLKFTKKSATFQSALGTAGDVAAGDGFTFEGMEDHQIEALKIWMRQNKIDRSKMEEISSSICLFGGSYQILIVTKNSDGKLEFSGADSLAFQSMRVGKPNKKGKIDRHWHSILYNQNRHRSDLKGYPTWDGVENAREDFDSSAIVNTDLKAYYVDEEAITGMGKWSCMVAKSNLYSDFYPSAAWESDAAINATLLEDAIIGGDIADKENGMTAGYIVTVPYAEDRKDPTKNTENKTAIEGKIRDELQGVDNKGKIVVMYQDPRSNVEGIRIAPIPHINTSDMGKMMEDRKDQILLTAWRIPDSRIIGIPPKAGKSLNNEAASLAEADDNWYVNFIEPQIVAPIEKFLNDVLLRIFEDELGITLSVDAKIRLKRKKRFSFRPSDVIQNAGFFTQNEVRAMYGYGPLTDEQKLELTQKAQPNGNPNL